jgi:hypothetical protein
LHWLNGQPAMLVEFDPRPQDRLAPRFVTLGELDAEGRVRRIYTLLAPEKIDRAFRALSPSGTETPS